MSTPAARPEVLVVDDEAPVREILVRWLEAAGYQPGEAVDAPTALALVARREPAVVLCDVRMPGQDGLWLVGQLRELHPKVAVILATAADDVPPSVSLQRGVVGYVVKPFQREQLLAVVRSGAEWHVAATQLPANSTADAIDQWLHGRRDRAKGK